MPIIGLTTNAPQFPKIGTLRKGDEKTDPKKPGPDLKYFRYTSERYPVSVKAFYDAFGNEPNHITVLLPYATVDENWQAWREEYTASRLQHRCDGQYVQRYYDKRSNGYITPDKPMACPGGCKPTGRLTVIIPALIKAGHVGTVTLGTTSVHDIINLDGALKAYYQMRGDLRGIEFVLYRYPEKVTTPDGPRREKWLVGLKPNHEWVIAQLQAQKHQALTGAPALLESGDIDMETGEIIDATEAEAKALLAEIVSDAMWEEVKGTDAADPLAKKALELIEFKNRMESGGPDVDAIAAARAALEKYMRMTGIQVADALVNVNLYDSRQHVENALKHNESYGSNGGKLSAGVVRDVGLDWFDWLVGRKVGEEDADTDTLNEELFD